MSAEEDNPGINLHRVSPIDRLMTDDYRIPLTPGSLTVALALVAAISAMVILLSLVYPMGFAA